MTKKYLALLVFIALLLMFSNLKLELGGTNSAGDLLGPNSFIDDMGNRIEVDGKVKTLISLSPTHTENIYALGGEALLIGVDEGSNYPYETQSLTTYRLDKALDQEAIINAQPDMVLIDPDLDGTNRALIGRLEASGLCVVALMPESLEDFGFYMTKLGIISGKEAQADLLIGEFYSTLDRYKSDQLEGPLVYIEGWQGGHSSPTEESLVAQSVALAGGKQMMPSVPWYKKVEGKLVNNATFMAQVKEKAEVFISVQGDGYTGPEYASVMQQPIYQGMNALENNQFYLIESPVITRYTMRYLSGVEDLRRLFYGDPKSRTSLMSLEAGLTRIGMATVIYEYLSLPTYVMNDPGYYEFEKFHHTYGSFTDVHWQDEDYDLIETVVMKGFMPQSLSARSSDFSRDQAVTIDDIEHFIYIWKDARGESLRTYLSRRGMDLEMVDTIGEFIELLEVMATWS